MHKTNYCCKNTQIGIESYYGQVKPLKITKQKNLGFRQLNFKGLLIVALLLAIVNGAVGQTNYYSKSAGNLNLVGSWGTNTDGSGASPVNFTNANQIFNIRNNATPTIGANWTVSGLNSRVVIGDGTNSCVFTVPTTFIFTATAGISNNATLRITSTAGTPYSGTLTVNSGGTYEHARNGGAIPAATWNSGSTCLVTGITNTALTSFATNPNFGNFIWNCPSQTVAQTLMGAGVSCTIQDNMSVLRTNTQSLIFNSGNGTPTHRIVGDLTIGDGTNAALLNLKSGGNGEVNIQLGGNLTVNANGTLTRTDAGTASFYFGYTGATASSNVNWGGVGTYTNTNISYIVQNIPTGKIVSLTRNMTIPASRSITFVNGTLDCGTNTISGGGTFNLSSGATLATAHIEGVANTGASGCIQTTTRTIDTGGNLIYNGVGPQVTGTFNASSTINNLTINNSNGVTLSNQTTVSGTLTLTAGVLTLDGLNLTLSSTNAIAGSPFDNTKMVETNGTGYLILNAGVPTPLFPVGSNGYYSPFSISAIDNTTGTISARTLNDASLGSNYLPRYWDILTSASGKTITATFSYDGTETTITPTNVWVKPASGSWQTPVGTSSFGTNSFTITSTDNITTTSTQWTAGLLPNTYFSYQTGDWNKIATWTSDPGGTTQIGTTLPGPGDVVVILPGRTVTLTADTATTGLEININTGGILNLNDKSFTSGLYALKGTGTLQLSSTNFPSTTVNSFVQTGGGTTVYKNSASFTLQNTQGTYNNLTIEIAAGQTATQLHNLTLNGDLLVKQGKYQINDNSSATRLILSIAGNLTVNSGAAISVGQGSTNTTTNPLSVTGGTAPFLNYYEQFHRVIINGNFTNNGTVNFTNLEQPLYNLFPPTGNLTNSGAATVYFQGTANSTMLCNGETDFYNLVLNKGADQTYKLTIQPSAYGNFRIFGANIAGTTITANPDLQKALWIRNGSLEFKGTVIIPSLTEGTTAGTEYYIPANGAMLISGSSVIILNTADDAAEANIAYGVSGTTGVTVSEFQNMVVFGKLQMNAGYFSTRESAGLIYRSEASGQFELNGGTIDAKQFRTYNGTAVGAAYRQTGGTFILRGRFVRPVATGSIADLKNTAITYNARAVNGTDDRYGTFNLEFDENIFSMSGGTIRLHDASGTNGIQKIIDVGSTLANSSVTGGTIEVLPQTGTVLADFTKLEIYSKEAVLGNLTINRGVGCATYVRLRARPLSILQNFTLTSGEFRANAQNLTVGGNLTVSTDGTYNSTATTTLNGYKKQTFTIDGTINNGAAGLTNLVIDRTTDSLKLAGSQSTLIVQGTFDLNGGVFADGGKTVSVAGNITNSGVHAGAGKIQLNGTAIQTIGGNGSGVFKNLELNNSNTATAPVSLIANMCIHGNLTFTTDKSLNISSYNVILDTATVVTGPGSGTYRYFQTNGDAGDGGLTKIYAASSTSFTFPLGAPSTRHATAEYTPTTIGFSTNPTTFGSITIIPVGYEHPATTTKGQSLTYFWRVKSSGFTGIVDNSITHSFQYSSNDIVGSETNYIPALYDSPNYTWVKGTNTNPPMNTGSNIFTDWTTPGDSRDYLNSDYTAGDNAFGSPTIYYSRASAQWDLNTTWSTDPVNKHTGAAAATFPTANDIVIIGNGNTVNLAANASCASLQIEAGAVLDVVTYTGGNFGLVQNHSTGNNGKIRVTSSNATLVRVYSFPGGDFSDFNINKGTTEFYSTDGRSTALSFLPSSVTSYGNLMLTPFDQDNLALPNTNVTIYGDLTCQGTDINSWIALSYYNATLYPTIEKTIYVKGNVTVLGGSLIYTDDYAPQHMIVDGNITVANNVDAAIDVRWGGWIGGGIMANTMSVGGTITNNNRFRLLNDVRYCNITFHGSNSAFITNTAGTPTTVFNNVTVNKGTTQDSTLTCNIAGTLTTPVTNWLTLQNGTFKYERTGDLTITTNNTFTIPSTAGLYINTPSDVLISYANSDNNDMYLEGKLTLASTNSGTVYVGDPARVRNNDIEYAGGGFSEMEINGGSLIVNGQVRRSPSMAGGVLKFTQNGGAVTINGQNATTENAKFEVCNTGSVFNMSDGTLTIVRGGGGTTYGDVYIRPHSSTVTGGTIEFAHNINNTPQTYRLDANVPLYNMTITGRTAATAANAQVELMVNPLVLKGSLLLSNGYSILKTNNINVSIKVDLINNGTANCYLYGTNTTTFNGGVQEIAGSSPTNFNNLTINPVTSVTRNNGANDIIVYGNLILSSGTLICGNRAVYLKGNLTNNAAYTETQYGIILNGTTAQTVGGLGNYARLEINNILGVKALTNINLSKNLALTNGVFNIEDKLLSLSQISQIDGSGFSATKMITTNGVFSDQGIKKVFGTGASTFTYPIGVAGKYTKVDVSITNATAGSIRINNVNDNHPAVLDDTKVLQYYWSVESLGITSLSGDLVFNYLAADVMGNEADYDGARLNLSDTTWNFPGNMDIGNNTITYNFTGTNYLGDEYTAGDPTAFPDEIPVYKTIKNGNWNDPTIWVQTAGTTHPLTGGPNGFIVIIDSTVTTNANFCKAYRTTLNGVFRSVSPYSGHNLGTVTGGGTLYLESQIIPAGKYSTFFDCSNTSTLEYGGSGSYTLLADLYNQVPRLKFSGTGTRILPPKDLTICHLFKIDGPTVDNSINNRKLIILDSMVINSGSFISGTGSNATVSFAGSDVQEIADFTGTNTFNNLEINNAKGLTLTGDIEVAGNLLLTNGLISATTTNSLTITNPLADCVIPEGGSATSYINGPLIKRLDEGIDNFLFPVGNATNPGNKFSIHFTETGTLDWTVTYVNPSSLTNTLSGSLTAVNDLEYWNLKSSSGSTAGAHISIKWDPSSNLTPLMAENGISDMRVAKHDGTKWVEITSAYTSGSDDYYGSAKTTNKESIATGSSSNFTLACVNTTKPRIRLVAPLNSVCGNAGIPIQLSASYTIYGTYTVYYTKDGGAVQTLNPLSFPATLPTDPLGGVYRLTGFKYNNPAGTERTGVYDGTAVTAYQVPTTASAGTDISLCGGTSTTLNGNSPTVGTGLWEILTAISGPGGTVTQPTNRLSPFNGITGNSYYISWTISNGTCESADTVKVSFPLLPAQPLNFIASKTPVCQGENDVEYTVPNDPLISKYNWTYTGGIVITDTVNQVFVDFPYTSTSGTLSVTASNDCGTSAPRSISLTVNAAPVVNFNLLTSIDSICDGDNTQLIVTVTAGASPFDITFTDGTHPETVLDKTSPYTFIPTTPPIWTGPTAGTTYTYGITSIVDNNGCSNVGSNTIDVVVFKIPETGPEYHVPNNYGL